MYHDGLKRSIKEGKCGFRSRAYNTIFIHRGVLEHVLEAVIENWKLGASDVQVEEVTGTQGKGR
jgi:hypothetical protein